MCRILSWAANVPDFVRAFLQDCDLDGKRVIPFATSRMTGIEGAVETLTMICGGASVEHPFFYSPRKKDNYKAWRAEVSAAPAEEAAEEAAPAEEAAEEAAPAEEAAEEAAPEE